jgi:hypothetical protein
MRGSSWLASSVSVVGATLLLGACASTSTGQRQDGRLAKNAPKDRPIGERRGPGDASPQDPLVRWQALIAPHSQRALATYSDARQRYLNGLPPGQNFFVTIILRDRVERFEQVFVLVDKIEAGVVAGRIASDILAVEGYHRGAPLTFNEAEIVDWLISKPDGSEEGNLVGKFLDTLPGQPAL